MTTEPGSTTDWKALADFHYRGHRTSAPRKIFRLTRKGEVCGVIVYSYSCPACYGRRFVLPRMSMKELNGQLCTINRVVIHPKYRTIGLGAKLIRETLPLAGTRYVELIAVMAKYSPFAEKAGRRKVAIQEPSREVRTMASTLEELGFDVKLLGSQNYVQKRLRDLTFEQLKLLKEHLARCAHPRFRKEFAISRHVPYGDTSEFRRCIRESGLPKLERLIRIVGLLLQTKVYLFYSSIPRAN